MKIFFTAEYNEEELKPLYEIGEVVKDGWALGLPKFSEDELVEKTKDADMIIVVNEGQVTGVGTHEELLKNSYIKTVFFGGGTPSILSGEDIVKILDKLRVCGNLWEDAEISIEANPGTVTEGKLLLWKKAGINRISFGLQSADNEELKRLGRIHTWEAFEENYYLARKCGFENINVDLMSALPGQTVDTWRKTMERVTALNPEHISAYSLIIEEGTPFYETYADHPELLPSEEEEREMYYLTKHVLKQYGYERYEISNYAIEGLECKHNQVYWERGEYLGVGLGAVEPQERLRYPTIAKRAVSTKILADGLSEEMRVLYVAMTRPKDRLIMTYASDS